MLAEPFEHSLARPPLPSLVTLSAGTLDSLVGTYRVSPELSFRMHLFKGRLFVKPQGAPMAEIELFASSETKLYSPVFPIEITIERKDSGEVGGVAVQMGTERLVATKESSA